MRPRFPLRCNLIAMQGFLLALMGLLLVGCGTVNNRSGTQLYQQGNYQASYQKFQQVISNDPKNADGYYNLAAITHRLSMQDRDPNKRAQAEQLYNQCLNYAPDHVEAHRGLAVLLTEDGRTEQAFTLLRNWTIGSPGSSEAKVELARLYEEYGDTRNAETYLQQALQLDQRNARAHAALGRIKEQLGDNQQALTNYQRAYSLNPQQPQIAERIAVLTGKYQSLNPGGNTNYNTGGLAGFFNNRPPQDLGLPSNNQNATRPKSDLRY